MDCIKMYIVMSMDISSKFCQTFSIISFKKQQTKASSNVRR